MGWNKDENVASAEKLVRDAAAKGANIILLSELFEGVYWCQEQSGRFFDWAAPASPSHPLLARFSKLAAELGVVLPISFFERANNSYYNTVAVMDADGTCLGLYRKSHIPDGVGYEEKFYFTPGDTGFRVWNTKFGKIGIAICWDQWFVECARCMALLGAELIFYPTAIGSEPSDGDLDSRDHWQRVMQGHAAANLTPVIASNRVGVERLPPSPALPAGSQITFYGSSFITDEHGAKVVEANRVETCVITHTFDLDAVNETRRPWGIFRDRRPDLYGPIATMDGRTHQGVPLGTNVAPSVPLFRLEDVK